MNRGILILCLGVLARASTLAQDAEIMAQGRDASSDGLGLPVVTYDGPLYKMSPAEYQNMTEAMENGHEWFVPDEVPRVEWTPGTVLDLGGGNSSSLEARSGAHQINVYVQKWCPAEGYLGGAYNFGCGGVCIFYQLPLYSAWLGQQFSGNPKPTANMYPNQACAGSTHQKIGIWHGKTSGCSNPDNCCGSWSSFYAYFNC